MNRTLAIVVTLLLIPCAGMQAAEFKLASLFADHAVLQRDKAVPIWGWGEPGEEVTVEFAGQKKTAKADENGKWLVKLDPLAVSAEPRELTVQSPAENHHAKISDVLVGDVWLCSGQSNMVVPVWHALDGATEVAQSDHPQLRFFDVPKIAKEQPQSACGGDWQACSPKTIRNCAAVAYFFGRELQTTLNVPIGLIQSALGSTGGEAWTSEAALSSTPEFKGLIGKPIDLDKATATNPGDHWADAKGDKNMPASLYNGMIAPLVPVTLRGAIWYQGENNANDFIRADAYRRLLPLMVESWRRDFGQEFPFYIVQLANFAKRRDSPTTDPWSVSLWSVLRESQTLAAATLRKSGLAVAIDIGEAAAIHPKNKQEVGRRLALIALANEYGQKMEFSGPMFSAMKIDGVSAVLTFTHAEGLASAEGPLKGFAITGADGHYQPAQAVIEGTSVRVSSPAVTKPVAVRYAWANDPDCNLINGAGLPASPFRTTEPPTPPTATTAPVKKPRKPK